MSTEWFKGRIICRHSEFPRTTFSFECEGVTRNVVMEHGLWPQELEFAMQKNEEVRLMLGPTGDPTLYGWGTIALGCFCSICGAQQWQSPSGRCCANGHGGVDSLTKSEAEEAGFEPVSAADELVQECVEASPKDRAEPNRAEPNLNGDIFLESKRVPGSWTDEQRQQRIQCYLSQGMDLWSAINRSAWAEIDDVMDAKFLACAEEAATKYAKGKA